jgi:NhaP-type Na+/H+ or K+/H+ antiporter
MVELTPEWASVVVTVGLVIATATLAWFTRWLAIESRRFTDAMNSLANQMGCQVDMSKLQLRQEADTRGRPPIKGIDEV